MPAPFDGLRTGIQRLAQAFLAIAFVAFAIHPVRAAEAIALSDIHFNPLADNSLAAELATAPPQQWAAILDRGTERMSGYGADTDWKLLKSALATMKAQAKPDFVLIPGDLLVHLFRDKYDAAFPQASTAGFDAFAAKTVAFVALQLQASFPATPIYPVFGNNDSDCGDNRLQPGGPLLAGTAATVARLIGPKTDGTVTKSWAALGNYVVPLPSLPGVSLIGLNSNFFAALYKNACGHPSDGDPAQATLDWLGRTLAREAAAHRKVFLLYHIPPGIDAYATSRHDSCPVTPVPLYGGRYADEFHALLSRYRNTVAASIAGHLHTDAFRLERDGDAPPFGFVMGVPALSPIIGQDPSFRRIRFDKDGTIADETTYYLANLVDAGSGAAPQWRAEASFDQAWNASRFDAASLQALTNRLASSADARERWTAEYGVQGPAAAEVSAQNFAIYRCSVGYDRRADAARCICAGSAR